MTHKKTYELLRPSDIQVDPALQRVLKKTHVAQMVGAFNPLFLGTPVIARRSGGALFVLDGQHRIVTVCTAGHGCVPIMCEVHSELTIAEEAEVFYVMNRSRIAISKWDAFKVRLVSGEQEACSIEAIVARCGLRVAPGKGRNAVAAYKALEFVHAQYGNLETTLTALKGYAPEDSSTYNGVLIKSMALFIHQGGDVYKLLAKLRPKPVKMLLSEISRQRMGQRPDIAGALLFTALTHRRQAAA